jgi:hypothetical protein
MEARRCQVFVNQENSEIERIGVHVHFPMDINDPVKDRRTHPRRDVLLMVKELRRGEVRRLSSADEALDFKIEVVAAEGIGWVPKPFSEARNIWIHVLESNRWLWRNHRIQPRAGIAKGDAARARRTRVRD